MIIVKTPQCTICKYSHVCKYRDTIKETFSDLYKQYGKEPLEFITFHCRNESHFLRQSHTECVTCTNRYICKYQEKIDAICSELQENGKKSISVSCKNYRK